MCATIADSNTLLVSILHMMRAQVIGLITAGGFVYVALVTVLPSLLEEPELWQSVWELLAIAAGVALMAMVCYFE